MPDWSYRTFLRPALLRLGPERARRLAVGVLAKLARLPGGLWFIDFLGHMRAGAELERVLGGRRFPGPVGLAGFVDPEGRALAGLSRFGCGFVEIGPVAENAPASPPEWNVDLRGRSITAQPSIGSAAEATTYLAAAVDVPVFVRVAPKDREEAARLASRFAPRAVGIAVDAPADMQHDFLSASVEAVRGLAPGCLVLLSVTPDSPPEAVAAAVHTTGAHGVWLHAEQRQQPSGALAYGAPVLAAVRAAIPKLRAALGAEAILVTGGVLEPADARDFLASGASLAAVDAGLVLSGPGLIKRTNEALAAVSGPTAGPEPFSLEAARHSWFWLFALGVAMLLGGTIATVLSCTHVLLPYDEALCGIPRGKLAEINPRLLPFMAHDRMSLAGTMLSIGILYAAIAWNAVRRGAHWAKVAVVVSATSGFFTFFLFLGFGYFDPFHAFVTAVLFQLMILGLHAPLTPRATQAVAEWRETPAWRRAQWGQLIFIFCGLALIGAGLVICIVGCTSVFVQTDLDFLRTTAAKLLVVSERLIPLIAHDRASLGGMLIANGLAIWLAAQWGFRAGERWLWWTFALAGNIAFAGAVGVHLVVGYIHWEHLAPAIAGWFLWLLALALTRPWLTRAPREEV
jgi:dihydroorotate dehydrogenase